MEKVIRIFLIGAVAVLFNGCSEKREIVLKKTETIPEENISKETIPIVIMPPQERTVEGLNQHETTNNETRLVSGIPFSITTEMPEKIAVDTELGEFKEMKTKTADSKKTVLLRPDRKDEKIITEDKVVNISPLLITGECLIYRIKWNYANVGKFILACKKEKLNNRDVYHIVGLTVPEGIWTRIGNGYNRFDSYIDSKNNLPFYYYNYSASTSTSQITKSVIDHNTKTLTYEVKKFKEGKQYGFKSGKIKFSDVLYDGLSSMYAIRGMVKEEMQSLQLPVGITKITNIYLCLLKKDIDIFPVGQRQYFLIQSEASEDEVFFKKGKLFVSISADSEKLPLLLKGKVPLGTATVELVKRTILDQNFSTDSKFLTEILNSIL
ncbi:MAG: DUF3108 domain-containing protein [bacterium]|nr:DUF3108 domain-containing protein [bacterium]